MELKKYVLMNDNTIITDIRHCSYDDKKYEYAQSRSKEGVVFMQDLMVSQVKKTSDNILDLLEERDLVELSGGKENQSDIHMIINVIDGNMITWDSLWIYKERDKNIISAIYKRKPNGDYKRYEVK